MDLTFAAPDRVAFPALDLGYAAGRKGGNAPAVLNAADEVAVSAFLDGSISFNAITEVVASSLDAVPHQPLQRLEDALEADRAGRNAAARAVADLSR
jgi:1-deoxy-D-xylulose-5-phosphate reductoisomerase